MASPTTAILDNFNRADDVTLGTNWTQLPLGGTDRQFIRSNLCAGNVSSGNYSSDYWNAASFGPDSECYFTFNLLNSADREIYVRLAGTLTAAGTTNGYSAYGNGASGASWGIYKYTGGVPTLLGATVTPAWANADQCFLQVVGTTFQLYQNGTSLASRTDATYTAAGRIGHTIVDNPAGARDDDFGGGTISSTTPVSKTVTASYNVKKSIVKTNAASYNVRQQIVKTNAASYTVKLAVVKTLAASYTVKFGVVKTRQATYNVLSRISKTLAASYAIGASPVNTVAPLVTGVPQSGNILSTTNGTWTNSPTSFTYQWQVETAPGSGVYTDIPGETANTLQL